MRTLSVDSFDAWRDAARDLLSRDAPPDSVNFLDQTGRKNLFSDSVDHEAVTLPARHAPPDHPSAARSVPPRVPPEFLDLARSVSCHRDAGRFQLLYRALWRLTHGEPKLLQIHVDEDVYRLRQMEKTVRRDAHKMKAFVRFRKVELDGAEHFIAWHRPDHRIVRLVAPFFSRRFPTMRWTILTPDESVSWDLKTLSYGPGEPRQSAPHADELENLWRTYYRSIFNPARIKVNAMIREMPVRHWATLPETDLIADLLAEAPRRVVEMVAKQEGHNRSALDFFPSDLSWKELETAARTCQGCDLFHDATQTVFGEGPVTAELMLVGEQPGDQEDLAGHPFVGPAGQVLDEALQAAGLERDQIYITNAVKHFKYQPVGQKRLHQKPTAREVSACRPWVIAELELVRPKVLVCLGATAAQSLIGPDFSITRQRGQFLPSRWCPLTLATYHPSAILRSASPAQRNQLLSALVTDLNAAHRQLQAES